MYKFCYNKKCTYFCIKNVTWNRLEYENHLFPRFCFVGRDGDGADAPRDAARGGGALARHSGGPGGGAAFFADAGCYGAAGLDYRYLNGRDVCPADARLPQDLRQSGLQYVQTLQGAAPRRP